MTTSPAFYHASPDLPEEITSHPMWETQVSLEYGMRQYGVDHAEAAKAKYEDRGQMTRLRPVRSLVSEMLPKVTKQLVEWLDACSRTRGVTPVAASYLRSRPERDSAKTVNQTLRFDDSSAVTTDVRVDAEVAALIALRTVFDSISQSRTGITPLAVAIGQTVEHEAKVRLWEAVDRDSFYSHLDFLKRTGATSTHRRSVSIYRFNKHLEDGKFGQGWTAWGPEVHFRVGASLLDVIIRATGWFDIEDDPLHTFRKGQKHGPKKVLMAKPGLTEWLDTALKHDALLDPEFKPTVVPPKRWDGTRSGGYWTPYVRTPRLIRFKASQIDQRDRAADEYEALDMPEEYDAIHVLQETAWRINHRVLEVVRRARMEDAGMAGLPVVYSERLEMPEAIAEDPEALKRWKREENARYRADIRRSSKVKAANRIERIAIEYAQFERFYFPHMMDFRGRKYPIPVGLQPQGDDLARGLLEFADGLPITAENEGAAWLAVHLASAWGHDKWTYAERIAWTHANEDLFRRIAADPFASTEWAVTSGPNKVDKPWVALAAIFDWVGYLDTGEGYLSHTPVSLDGTCNGIQHLAAMTRDAGLGDHVNLLPAASPRDIYKHVAGAIQGLLEQAKRDGGLSGDHAAYWLEVCGGNVPRSLTKRQVMVLPYGGTRDSYFTYTREWLDDEAPVSTASLEAEEATALLTERSQRIAYMTNLLWGVVNEVAAGAMGVMHWLQKTAKHATEANQPIFWKTPAGFPVRHFYGKHIEKQVEVKLDGTRYQQAVRVTTKDLDIKSQLQGIAPNFVHALDAAALTKTIALCKAEGIVNITAVHDAYGTHAANMWRLYEHLRTGFVQVHTADVLGDFRQACASVLTAVLVAKGSDPLEAAQIADERLDPVPAKGSLDLADVMLSEYFFS